MQLTTGSSSVQLFFLSGSETDLHFYKCNLNNLSGCLVAVSVQLYATAVR